MGGRDTRFGTRRCAFDNEPYGVAESYSREGMIHLCLWATFMALFFDDLGPWRLVRNIAPTRELEALRPSLRVYDPSFGLFPGGSASFRRLDACKASSAFLSSGCYVFLCGLSIDRGRFAFLC
ncbi:hypothetical protein PIB30_069884 [Stylosanthes scabra]|uniref:Uncharacterized protein n=1 Tax=Stylosanthes scabra TaxID=79078 RepID=A0ABU6QQI1_9FABA|nr:hypothetical protein [Stylosanthes scabra]